MTLRQRVHADEGLRCATVRLVAVLALALSTACAPQGTARGRGGDTAGEPRRTLTALPTTTVETATAATATVDTPPAPANRPPRSPDVQFVPTPDSVVVAMLRAADVSESDLVYDLGSGDGRIVVAAAKRFGARGVGIDIDPQRIAEARVNAERAGVEDRVEFVQGDLFEAEFGDATVVTLYLLPELNRRLRPRLFAQLKPGTPLVSHGFDMGEWQPDSSFRVESRDAYLWVMPAHVGGSWTWTSAGGSPIRDARLELRQRFQQVEGSMTVSGTTFELLEPDLTGDALIFTGRGTLNGRMVTTQFTGRVSGNMLTGTMDVSEGPFAGRSTWTARREAAQADIAPADSADA